MCEDLDKRTVEHAETDKPDGVWLKDQGTGMALRTKRVRGS